MLFVGSLSAEGNLRRLALLGLLDLEQAGRLEVEHAGDDHRGERLPPVL